jgi:hypothetical protein
MVLFVLYIEPLIQAINSRVQGMELQQSNVKSLAYTNDINFVVKSDEEIGRAFEAIELFCSEFNDKITIPKSAFLRINNCKVGPQKIKEVYSMKELGLVFEAKVRNFIKTNYVKPHKHHKLYAQPTLSSQHDSNPKNFGFRTQLYYQSCGM